MVTAVAMALLLGAVAICLPRTALPTEGHLQDEAPAGHALNYVETGKANGAAHSDTASVIHREVVATTPARPCSGCCVDWVTRAPLPGCEVSLGEHPASRLTTVTDERGYFSLALPRAWPQLSLVITAPDRVAVTRVLSPHTNDLPLANIRLRAAGRVAGMLVDDRGRACANRLITWTPSDHVARTDGWQERLPSHVRTRADGSFAFDALLPAGTLYMHAPEEPRLYGETQHVLLPGRELFLSLQCRSWQSNDELRGVVVDAAGQPVPAALLHVATGGDLTSPTVQSCWSDPDGSFCLIRHSDATAAVWLRAACIDGSLQSACSGPHHWGETGIRIELSRANGVWLHVVDAVTGVAIEHYAVQHVRTTGVRSALAGELCHAGHHAGGRCFLEEVVEGSHEVIIWPEDMRWLPCLPHAFAVESGGSEVRISLVRVEELPVLVTTTSGQSVAGATVHLIRPSESVLLRDLSQVLLHGGSRMRPNMRLTTAVTDEDGLAMLRWCADGTPLQLRIEGAAMAPHLEDGVRLQPSGVTVRVADSGVLRAELPAAAGMRLQLVAAAGQEPWPPAWSAPLELNEAGQLRHRGQLGTNVPVGNWQVRLMVPHAHGVWRTLPDVLTEVEVRSKQLVEIQPSLATTLAFAEVSGRAFVDGQPAVSVALVSGSTDRFGNVRPFDVTVLPVNDRGEFLFPQLLSGHYAIEVRLTCSGQLLSVPVWDWHAVAGGQEVACGTLAVVTAPWTVALRDASQAAITEGLLVLRGANGAALTGAPNDQGLVVWDRVPIGRYEPQFRGIDSLRMLPSIEVVTGSSQPHLLVVR